MQIELRKAISNESCLCIGTLTREQATSAGLRASGSDIGYFLYERTIDDSDDQVTVLARFMSDEAARRIANLLDDRRSGRARDLAADPSAPWSRV